MSRLQSKGYSLSFKQKIIIAVFILFLISVVVILFYILKKPKIENPQAEHKISESQYYKASESTVSKVLTTEKNIETTKKSELKKDEFETEKTEKTELTDSELIITDTTTKSVKTEILIIIEEGEIYAEHSDGISNICFKKTNYDENSDNNSSVFLLESLEDIDFNGSILEIKFCSETVQINSPLIPTFLIRMENVLNRSDFEFSEDWIIKLNQLRIKHEQLNQAPQIEIEELPDTYPASYAHSNIRIISVDLKSFDVRDEAEDYAKDELPGKAKELDVSGYIISRGLLNNGEVKYLIYWLK
ncbi:MAG: hypothetical protein ACOX3H_02585 [Saccharofermentanales bacterium]